MKLAIHINFEVGAKLEYISEERNGADSEV
jgi:hypothetical protein